MNYRRQTEFREDMMTDYRLLTFQSAQGPRAGIAVGDVYADVAEGTGRAADASMLGILEDWAAAQGRLSGLADKVTKGGVKTMPLASAHYLAAVHWPVAIYCAGANYADHVRRMAERSGLPQEPNPKEAGSTAWHFLKPARTAVGHNEEISTVSKSLDWEAELAVVIGKGGKNIPLDKVYEHIAGYTCANDVSARDLSRRPKVAAGTPFSFDWIGQKCFDGSCPLGPWIVPASQIKDPMNLAIKTFINDKLQQNSNTKEMIFNIADQVAQISSRMTLYPGDVVLTGTPSGTGAEENKFLKAGDVMRVEIEGIGSLTNRVKSITG
jgi:2-keto-4-pentenoate hydratase/2-oxohepta-3-ene-1,7-dioic acid hydratase in catechol pathway